MGLGFGEILMVVLVLLLVVGPQKLPEYARKMGSAIRNIKNYTSGLTKDFSKILTTEDKPSSSSTTARSDSEKKDKSTSDFVGDFVGDKVGGALGGKNNPIGSTVSNVVSKKVGKSLSNFLDETKTK